MIQTKSYPASLHMYRMHYKDNTQKVLYACGMTHAYAISRECWPNLEILEVCQLDDLWKN